MRTVNKTLNKHICSHEQVAVKHYANVNVNVKKTFVCMCM